MTIDAQQHTFLTASWWWFQ